MAEQAALAGYIKKELANPLIKKIKGKHPPISEIVERDTKTLPIKAIYDLTPTDKNFYLLIVKNYSKQPKIRYLLGNSLASQSSDLLVLLASDFIKKDDNLKLIQYSIHPSHHRINLMLLKEIKKNEDYPTSINLLKSFRQIFRKKLDKIKTSLENK